MVEGLWLGLAPPCGTEKTLLMRRQCALIAHVLGTLMCYHSVVSWIL